MTGGISPAVKQQWRWSIDDLTASPLAELREVSGCGFRE
jgi:hypothetical protein